MYDISSAGHIPAGTEPLPSVLRELREELGIEAKPEELTYIGFIRCRYERMFHGKPFRDNAFRLGFVYRKPVDIGSLTLQESEVECVRWFPLKNVAEEIRTRQDRICISEQELKLLTDYLASGRTAERETHENSQDDL